MMIASRLARRQISLCLSARFRLVVASIGGGSNVYTRALGTSKKKRKGSGSKKKSKLITSPAVAKPEKEIDPKVKAWNEEQIAKLKQKKKSSLSQSVAESSGSLGVDTTQQKSVVVEGGEGTVTSTTNSNLKSVSAVLQAASMISSEQEVSVLTDEQNKHSMIPKGTVVYHGTSLRRLRSALQEGYLLPSPPGYVVQGVYKPPPAVFVGSFFKALTYSVLPMANKAKGIGTHNHPEDLFPVIVELELKDNSEIIIDHDFFLSGRGVLSNLMGPVHINHQQDFYAELHHDKELAGISWSKFHSAGIYTPIPTDWVRSIYTPQIQPSGVPHPNALHLTVAAMFLDVQKQTCLSRAGFWQQQQVAGESPLMLLQADDVLSGNPISEFDSDKFWHAATFRLQKQFEADSKIMATMQQAEGDPEVADAIFLRRRQQHDGVDDIISERMASFLEKYLV